MYYGLPPHIHSPDDLTILRCRKCDKISKEYTEEEMKEKGFPWYCDYCDSKVARFVTFHPSEREEAYKEI